MNRAGMTLAALVLALVPRMARAQQAAPQQQPTNPSGLALRQANYAWDPKLDVLRASFSYRDVLQGDPVMLKKLDSGLQMHIFMRAYVYEQGQSTPVTLSLRACTVQYDLWNDVYDMTISESGHTFNQAAVDQKGVLRVCTEARDLAIASHSQLTPGHTYFLGTVVDVNPASPQMVAAMQNWIAQPLGSAGGVSGALFGGFVGLFVRQIAPTDKTITFRTQDVVAP